MSEVADGVELIRLLRAACIPESEIVKIRFCAHLVARKIPFRAEYKLAAQADTARAKLFRADLAIMRGREPVLLVEAKQYNEGELRGVRQRQNYARCGIPSLLVGPESVFHVIAAIEAYLAGDLTRVTPFLICDSGNGVGGLGVRTEDSSLSVPSTLTKDPNSPIESAGERRKIARDTPDRRSGPRATWLTPYFEAYRTAYKLPPSDSALGRMARVFKGLEELHPRAEVVRRFGNYLTSTACRWYSVEHFSTTFPAWDRVLSSGKRIPGDVPDPEPGESTDAYITRLANLGF